MSDVEEDCMDRDECSEVGDESNLVEVMQQLDMLSAPDKIPETDETDHQLLVKSLKYLQNSTKLTKTGLMLMI